METMPNAISIYQFGNNLNFKYFGNILLYCFLIPVTVIECDTKNKLFAACSGH